VNRFQRQGDHFADGGTQFLARTLPAVARSAVILGEPPTLPGQRRRTGKGAPHQIIDRSSGERGGGRLVVRLGHRVQVLVADREQQRVCVINCVCVRCEMRSS
jgi:hypothetical protein